MKSTLIILILAFTHGIGWAQNDLPSSTLKPNNPMENQDRQAIEKLLFAYEKALNASDTKAVINLYSEDGVFMPSEAPSSIGKEAVEKAYKFVFSQIKLHISFSIDEIEVFDSVAFVRSISRGKTDVLAAGITLPEENRELFVLRKEDGVWKIARYMFNKMAPQK